MNPRRIVLMLGTMASAFLFIVHVHGGSEDPSRSERPPSSSGKVQHVNSSALQEARHTDRGAYVAAKPQARGSLPQQAFLRKLALSASVGAVDPASSKVAVSTSAANGRLSNDALVARWRTENLDTEWTSEIEEYVVTIMEDTGTPTEMLGEVDCRQTLCRLTFLFDSADDGARLYALRDTRYRISFDQTGDEYTVFVERH